MRQVQTGGGGDGESRRGREINKLENETESETGGAEETVAVSGNDGRGRRSTIPFRWTSVGGTLLFSARAHVDRTKDIAGGQFCSATIFC